MDITEESPTCISFCYGIGGLDKGVERAIGNVQPLCVVEIEAVAVANVVAKMEAGAMAPCPVWTDVKTFPAHLFRDRVDWLLGGYPCTPFSLAGKRKGADDPRHLWPHFERSIEAMRPLFCLFENVDDHLTLGFPEVYESLQRLGYAVEVGIFSAEEVGAPHERQRMFILAIRRDVLADSAIITEREQTEQPEPVTDGGKAREELSESGELADDHSKYRRQQQQLEGSKGKRTRNESSRGSEMDHTGSNGSEQEHEVSTGGNAIEHAGEELANASNTRRKRIERGRTFQYEGIAEHGEIRWPARPGEQQYDWESPRTITRQAESDLGLTVDGISFREDLLRALGNAVVPQCAEIAIRTLLEKFRKHEDDQANSR